MKLKELNQRRTLKERQAGDYKLRESFAVGQATIPSKKGNGGTKLHLLYVEDVISSPSGLGVGETFSVLAACNLATDANTGIVATDADTAEIDCVKCQRILARITAHLTGKGKP